MPTDLIQWATTLNPQTISVTGLLLLFIIGAMLALKNEWVVTGDRYREKSETCKKCDEALVLANTKLDQVQTRDFESRLELERLRTERSFGWLPHPPRPPQETPS